MANILFQAFERGRASEDVIGIHRVQLTAASDSITVPFLSSANSITALRGPGDPSVTVSATQAGAVTLTGKSGDKTYIITHHPRVNRSEQRTSTAPTVD